MVIQHWLLVQSKALGGSGTNNNLILFERAYHACLKVVYRGTKSRLFNILSLPFFHDNDRGDLIALFNFLGYKTKNKDTIFSMY